MNRLSLAMIALFPMTAQAVEHWVFLDNGQVRIGANLDAGGSIGWFSRSHSPRNLLNTFDHGRYVQQSFYGDKDGSDWNGKPWRFNPVQGGSWKGVAATVLETKEAKDSLYMKTRPRHWATGHEAHDMTMEQWIGIDGGLARLRFRMTFTGTMTHQAAHQELPAVFADPGLETLVYCEEKHKAWSGAPLTRKQPGFPNEEVKFSEPWAAWEDKSGQALGIYFPHAATATAYRVRDAGVGNCSYIAPLQTFALKPGLVFEYEAVLATGAVEQIRAVFSKLDAQRARSHRTSSR